MTRRTQPTDLAPRDLPTALGLVLRRIRIRERLGDIGDCPPEFSPSLRELEKVLLEFSVDQRQLSAAAAVKNHPVVVTKEFFVSNMLDESLNRRRQGTQRSAQFPLARPNGLLGFAQ